MMGLGVQDHLEWGHGPHETVGKEEGFIPRAFAGFQVGGKKKKKNRKNQHEQICNLKISLRLLHKEMIQEWQEKGWRRGSRKRPGRKGWGSDQYGSLRLMGDDEGVISGKVGGTGHLGASWVLPRARCRDPGIESRLCHSFLVASH